MMGYPSSVLMRLRPTMEIDNATCRQIANTPYDQEMEGLELAEELTRMIQHYPKDSWPSFQGDMNVHQGEIKAIRKD